MAGLSEQALKAADSICNYCSTRFPEGPPPCQHIDRPWFAEKVQVAIDDRIVWLESQIGRIREYAHGHSTGPEVEDACWEIRRACDAVLEGVEPSLTWCGEADVP